MKKTCFVIMGFGIKNNMNLDLTYDKIIKPCIISNKLIPFPLYNEKSIMLIDVTKYQEQHR